MSNEMSLSDVYIEQVKKNILDMYKELQAQHTTFDDRLSTCYQNVAKCVELFWTYRAVNPRFPKGKEDWFDKDLAGWRVLELIRDEVKPLLETAVRDMGRFNAYVQRKLVGLSTYVEAGWRPLQVSGASEASEASEASAGVGPSGKEMRALLSRMQELAA